MPPTAGESNRCHDNEMRMTTPILQFGTSRFLQAHAAGGGVGTGVGKRTGKRTARHAGTGAAAATVARRRWHGKAADPAALPYRKHIATIKRQLSNISLSTPVQCLPVLYPFQA
jgi:hypothetical protein